MRLEDEIAQEKFQTEFQKGYINILFTSNWLNNKAQVFYKQYEVTQQQYNVLRILRGQYPKPCTVNLIKERMIDKMCDASRIIDRLKIKEFVERRQNELDRRAADVLITDKGLEILKTLDTEINKIESPIKNLSQEEVQTLNSLLDKIRD